MDLIQYKWIAQSIIGVLTFVAIFITYRKSVNRLDTQDYGALMIVIVGAIGFILFKSGYLTFEILYKLIQ